MEQLLKEKTALVTGGTAGIGKAIAERFLQHGAKVAIVGSSEKGSETKSELSREFGEDRVLFFQADVGKTEAVNQLAEDFLQKWGKIDILVNNAGITRDRLLLRMLEDDWDRVMEVNVKSCYNTTKAFLRSMMKARSGKIINVSSIIGLIGNAGQANYAASKAAMIGFTKSMAKELAPRQICVNSIAPGYIETRMTDVLTEEQKKEVLTKIPLGRVGVPEDVAHLALFLASSFADYMTGQILVVDGGMTL